VPSGNGNIFSGTNIGCGYGLLYAISVLILPFQWLAMINKCDYHN